MTYPVENVALAGVFLTSPPLKKRTPKELNKPVAEVLATVYKVRNRLSQAIVAGWHGGCTTASAMKIQIALPIAIVVSLIAIIPPPRIVLDLLLSANISLSVVILLASYPTNGQRVPEDLLIPSAGEPARHVLNLEPAI